VMNRYLKHQFYEHPSISAVLAWHLADNYVKPDDAQGTKIKALENQLKQLETSQSTLQSKYDTLRVAFNWLCQSSSKPSSQKTGRALPPLGAGRPILQIHPSLVISPR
jgi:hypothetical protein